MSTQDDAFPELTAYPVDATYWERERGTENPTQVPHAECASHVEFADDARRHLPGEAAPSEGEMVYYWAPGGWTRSGGSSLSPSEFEDRLTGTGADVSRSGDTVEFDIFDVQAGSTGFASSRARFGFDGLREWLVVLPFMVDFDAAVKLIQLRWFLEDVPLLNGEDSATIRGGVPYLHGGEESGRSPAGDLADLVEDIVDAYVGESTGDTLDAYPETY